MDLQEAIFTIGVFYTAFTQVKELTSQQKTCGIEPDLREVTGLAMFPIIPKQLAW